ncbi:MAG TPA: NAD(P)-dependent oxidoreductase [Ferruginibacter sp.]|nr:NAD(P)-dependent oxidoreductase [Ferruginibacter sp.]
MRTLIIGGTSALGRALKPVLSEFSEVITAGRKDCDINFDLTDTVDKMSIPADVDTIIHTAAHFGGKSVSDMLDAELVNVVGTLNLCQVAKEATVKHFILISSMSACVKEDSAYYGIYAISKRHSEEVAKFYCSTHSLSLTVLRPSQIYGNDERFNLHQPFIYSMIDKAQKGEDITIYGSHDALRNYIHIDDLTAIISNVVRKKLEGVYSCTHTENVTYSQIAEAAFHAFNTKGSVHFLKDKPAIPDNIFEKDDSLYEKIGFYPQVSIEEGMQRIAHYRKSSL